MCKTLKKLAILLILVLSFVFVVVPIISAEEIEDNEVTEDNVVENKETTLPEENEPEVPSEEQEEDTNTNEEENPPSEDKPTEEDKKEEKNPIIDEEKTDDNITTDNTTEKEEESIFKQFINWLEEIGFVKWLEEDLIPAIPQSFWSLVMSLLVLLSTFAKNKKTSNDIVASINSMGLAKTSMDNNNALLNSIVSSRLLPAIEQMQNTAVLTEKTNEDMMKYKADLKLEIDGIKATQNLILTLLSAEINNNSEMIKNGQAEKIARVVKQYEKEREEKETN